MAKKLPVRKPFVVRDDGPTCITGIDPGLVHTGVVHLCVSPHQQNIDVSCAVVDGIDLEELQRLNSTTPAQLVFIEDYRPRSHFTTDAKMMTGVRDIKNALPGSILVDNSGVKKTVTEPLLAVFGCSAFKIPSNHQDLKSAARIAILGGLKTPAVNRLFATIVRAHAFKVPWTTNSLVF